MLVSVTNFLEANEHFNETIGNIRASPHTIDSQLVANISIQNFLCYTLSKRLLSCLKASASLLSKGQPFSCLQRLLD